MSATGYFSETDSNSHISLTESDIENMTDLDHSVDSSTENVDQTGDLIDRINSWLNMTESNQTRLVNGGPTLEEMYMDIITNIMNYSIQFDITNLNLVSFDMLNHLNLEELETYRENILIRAESIPRTLYIMVNQHLTHVTIKINQIINAEFTN